jgi:hypothetical protein
MVDYKLVEARESHLDGLVKLCLKGLREGHEKDFPFNKYKVKNTIWECVTNPHQLALVAIVNGQVKGVCLGYVTSHAYADGLVAEDLALYVAPSLRGSGCYQEMAEAYDKWCSRIPNLLGATLSLSRLNATTQVMDKSYKALGYKRVAVTYLKLRGEA